MAFQKTWPATLSAWSRFTRRYGRGSHGDIRFRIRAHIVEPAAHAGRPVEVVIDRPEQARLLAEALTEWVDWHKWATESKDGA